MLVIQPVAVLLAAPVFIGAILLTRYVSLGSLLGSAAMVPAMLLVLLLVPGTPLPYVIYSAVGAAFIWLAHADNIDRLLHGTERKFDLRLLAGKRPSGG
jgi:glycerol-3-phosphate acyltransferase PlsY